MSKALALTVAAVMMLFAGSIHAGDWHLLVNGKNLDGWKVLSGFARYEIVDGAIVGTAVKGSPNTYLCTTRNYADFELEFEVKCDPGLNSGVNIRSLVSDEEQAYWFWDRRKEAIGMWKIPPGRVHGYHAEIVSGKFGKFALAGRVYDDGRRRYYIGEGLHTTDDFYKPGEWNTYRILCYGQSIKIWVNETLCTDLQDAMTSSGFIGLQVHGMSRNFRPLQSRWRNIRLRELE
jgi:hypothetical protein